MDTITGVAKALQLERPVCSCERPAGHWKHAVSAVSFANEPAAHDEHDVEPGDEANVPKSHGPHVL